MTTATDILQAAAGHMQDRAATYDKPEGERSMGATVEAFKSVTGHQLTEEQGWLFMSILKAVRSQQGAYRKDSYEDGAAYFALAGEAAEQDRKKAVIPELYSGGWTPEAIDQAAFKGPVLAGHEIDAAWEEGEKRMEQIGPNGNDGLAYENEWIPSNGKKPELPDGTLVDVKFLDGYIESERNVGIFAWSQDGESDDITHYRIHQPE